MAPPELVVFDFDGTLAHRPGMWTQCLLDVLDSHTPRADAWMIGDNPAADERGAAEAGMHGALVQHPTADFLDVLTAVQHCCGSRTQAMGPAVR